MGEWLAKLLAEESHGDEESEDCDSATLAWKSERIQLWAETGGMLPGGYSIGLSPNTSLMWGRKARAFGSREMLFLEALMVKGVSAI